MSKMDPLKHDFDGIQELDNLLPRWWLWLFYITIAFAAVYFVYYEVMSGPSLNDELQADLSQIKTVQMGGASGPAGPSPDELNAIAKDPKQVLAGKAIFSIRCLACHGASGEGGIGPNLTDDYWITGKGTMPDIVEVIRIGVGAKGMPPWGPILSAEELGSVSAFVKSLKGTHPPNGKAPQGEAVKD